MEVDGNELFSIRLKKKEFDAKISKSFKGVIYDDWLEDPSDYLLKDGVSEIGYIEVYRESWNKRLRITEILILEDFRALGYGSFLINKAKEIALKEDFREVILETQTCNSKAIEFYLKNGFRVNGIDLSCYGKDDVANGEVRLEMVYII